MDLPTYSKSNNIENYNEELSQTLIDNLSNNGFVISSLSATEVTEVLALVPPMPSGTLWYNNTLGKMQFINNSYVVETITSV